jgi:hypothetical protein
MLPLNRQGLAKEMKIASIFGAERLQNNGKAGTGCLPARHDA